MAAGAPDRETGLVGDVGRATTRSVSQGGRRGDDPPADSVLMKSAVMPNEERRTNPKLRRRIDELLERVRAAREEIVESGLDAVHHSAEHRPRHRGRFARTPSAGTQADKRSTRQTQSRS
jgi:hypothetical protein